MTCVQPARRLARLGEVAQVARVDLAALAHPVRRRALVGDAHLPVGVAQQPAHDRGADRAGAAGDEDAAHRRATSSGASATQLGGVAEHLGGAEAVPRVDDERRRGRARRRSARSAPGPRNSVWLVATTTASASRTASSKRLRRRRDVRVVDRDVGQLALEQADELVRQRVALVVGVGLEGEPEDGDLAARSASRAGASCPPRGTAARDSLTRETASSMPGALERSSLKAKSLRRQVPAVKPGQRDAAARVVAVDEVDDLEDVRAVLLAVHHQQVGQRERRVAQDVRPDLRQLGLDRRRLHDRRAEDLEQLRRRARRTRSPTPPTMHGSVSISSKKRPAAIRSGTWATKTSSPIAKPRCLAR